MSRPLITPKGAGHYYTKEGVPKFDADLRIAKKENLLPSITTVLKLIEKPGLSAWKMEQILMSALTSPAIKQSETEEDYINRVIESAEEESTQAADFGSFVHKAIEIYLSGQSFDNWIFEERVLKSFEHVKEHVLDNLTNGGLTECPFASIKHGYAGTIDFLSNVKDNKKIIIDWKTQNIKWKTFAKPTDNEYELKIANGKYSRPNPAFYDDFVIQLAACGMMVEELGMIVEQYVTILINSSPHHPEVIITKVWDNSEIEWGKKVFLSLLNTWRLFKKFPY